MAALVEGEEGVEGQPAVGEPAEGAEPVVDVSAVVVNYNVGPVLGDCVASLRADGVAEVVVVDNGSWDGSLRWLREKDREATWAAAGGNLGYGRAANLGARSCRGHYLLVCNSDLVVKPGTIAALVHRLEEDPRAGIVGPRLVNADGMLYPSARTFPSLVDAIGHGLLGLFWPDNRFSRRYKLLDWDHTESRVVDWVSGAFFVIRRELWDAIDGFDLRYFMYMEDVDLCWRAGRAGWQVVYEPSAEVAHWQGLSTDRQPYRMILAHHRSLWRFARRSTAGWQRVLLPPIGMGLVARAGVACGSKWRADRSTAGGRRSTRGRPATANREADSATR